MHDGRNGGQDVLPKSRIAGIWVTILYFAEGYPYTLVNQMSIIFFKALGASNELIGLTSILYLPWALKGLWGPVVDVYSTKRRWILGAEIVCAGLFLVLAIGTLTSHVMIISIVCFAAIAFVSATHDIAIDGFYLDALDKNRQAFYSGFRTTAYRVSWLVGSGGLVFLAGYIADMYLGSTGDGGEKVYRLVHGTIHPIHFGWAVTFGISACIFLLIYGFQTWYLPDPRQDRVREKSETTLTQFLNAFRSYFSQNRIGWIVAYVLLIRLGDAFMLKMAPPFLMDTHQKGGLAISTAEIGILYGTVGIVFLLGGGILGGYLVSKQGLKRWLWPTALLQNGSIVLYWILALTRPSLPWVYAANSFEQFSFGMGVSAFVILLMRTVRPEYRASHYAITTAFMAAGMLIPGIVSGYLQAWMGYPNYFLMSFLVAIPGLITIFFLPLEEKY
jgi:MFS transporter, PAT family, beta-lactamase induction signal transducer AmpG